jgi:hypothetical protein
MRVFIFILNFCLLFCSSLVAADDSAKLAALQQRIVRLETGIKGVEAIRAVKRLQYSYGHYAESGLWNDLADLFADNAIARFPSGLLGKEGMRDFFLQEIGGGSLGLRIGRLYSHIMLQPVVTLASDGKTAKGRWREFAILGEYGNSASWTGGIYENEYIQENGVWKINNLHYYPHYSGQYEQAGWTAAQEAIPIHYSPAGAGTPILENSSRPVPSKAPRSLAILSRQLSDLTARVQFLDDETEVENLQRIYGYYVDRKMWDDVADLFADNSTMELGLQGTYAGKTSIHRALDQFGSGLREGELNDHLQLQIIVHVAPDGRTAKARGLELVMSGVNGVEGQWGEGVFENEFIKQNEVWQIKSLHIYPRLLTDYDRGWAKDAKPAPGPSKTFPPDRPPTEEYKTFPSFFIAPFHFANPATGRAIQYPTGSKSFIQEAGPKAKANIPPTARTITELTEKIAEAERRLRIAEAYDATENLASAYGYYLDEFMWDETADLFAQDAIRDLSSIGVDVGREPIRKSLKQRYPGKKSADYLLAHQLIQPVIHVAPDGQSAKMRVRLFQLAGASGGNGLWIAGIYECSTGIEDGVWKFSAMDLDYIWTADYKGGWAHVSTKAGVVAAPFPKIIDLPFHYKNPITGRKPPVFVP